MNDSHPESSLFRPGPWAAAFVILIGIYATSATWSFSEQNVDTVAATLPAWHLATEGSFDLSTYAGANPWIVPTPDGYWTNRPPGLVAVAFVAHLLALPFTKSYSGMPGTAAAILASAAAVVIIGRLIARHTDERTGFVSIIALGLASATWPQSSRELIPHGIGQSVVALMLVSTSKNRLWLTGVLAGLAVTVRPPMAVLAAGFGLALAIQRRRVLPALQVGVPAAIGAVLVIAYNRIVFGSWSITGGYGDFISDGAKYRTLSGYLENLFGTFLDPSNGLLTWSPWIAVAVIGLFSVRDRHIHDWARAGAVGGIAYLLVHTGLNRFWGGSAFDYRYALEPLTAALPVLALGMTRLSERPMLRRSLFVAFGVSISLQAAAAYLLSCTDAGDVAVCTLT